MVKIFPSQAPARIGTLDALVWENNSQNLGVIYSYHLQLNAYHSSKIDNFLSIDSTQNSILFSKIAHYERNGLNHKIDVALGIVGPEFNHPLLGLASKKIYKSAKHPEFGETLYMYGVGSGGRLREAKVIELNKTLELNAPIYGSMKSTGVLLGPIDEKVTRTVFCSPGDSGAIWYNENFEAVGMHVAGHRCDKTNNILPFIYPITDVLEALDVTMLTPEDVANL